MKLNDDAPEQQLAILALGGFLLVFNLIMYVKDASKGSPESVANSGGPEAMVTQVVDESTGQITETPTLHINPHLSWTQKLFCRGFKRSSWCSDRELHPDALEAAANGVELDSSSNRRDHVVAYRGPMKREGIFSSRVSIPDQDPAAAYRSVGE